MENDKPVAWYRRADDAIGAWLLAALLVITLDVLRRMRSRSSWGAR